MKLNITESALKELARIGREDNIPLIVRVTLMAGGCNGVTINMFFSETPEDQFDFVFFKEDIKFLIDRKSALYLDNASLDYVEDGLLNRGFKWNLPNKGSCGCGISFDL